MAETEIEYERGAGELPQGEAGRVNELANQAQGPPEIDIPVSPAEDLSMPEIGEEGPDYKPADEIEELLFADAEGKGRELRGDSKPGYVPTEIVRKLPDLQRAASKPDAPPALVALYRLTVRALEDEMRQNG